MATTYNARVEYQPRNENEVLAVDPETGQPVVVTREVPQGTVFMPVVLGIIALFGALAAVVVGLTMFWDLLVGFAMQPGKG